MSEENKFALNFCLQAINDLSIKSGLLRGFVEDLGMSLDERMRFVRKLSMINIAMKNVEYQEQEAKRPKGNKKF